MNDKKIEELPQISAENWTADDIIDNRLKINQLIKAVNFLLKQEALQGELHRKQQEAFQALFDRIEGGRLTKDSVEKKEPATYQSRDGLHSKP